MLLFYLCFLLLCVYESEQEQQYWPEKYQSKERNAYHSHRRLVEIMRSYYEEAHSRLTYMNPIRFMYEESPFYEMGYITGEIIERYRKVLEHTQAPIRFPSIPNYEVLRRVELVQKLSFEIYHLVRMIHETPRKWISVLEFTDIEKIAGPDVVAGLSLGKGKDNMSELSLAQIFETQSFLEDLRKRREREKRRLRKEFERIRKAYLKSMGTEEEKITKKYNSIWPIDYGWEIDYEW